MTDTEWLACTDAQPLLDFLRDSGKLSERKARLFAVACAHHVWPWLLDERSRKAVEVSERYAEGLVGRKALNAVRREAFAASKSPLPSSCYRGYARGSEHAAVVALNVCMNTKRYGCQELTRATAGCASSLVAHVLGDAAEPTERKAQCDLLRCLFGSPFCPTPFALAWLTPSVISLAVGAYEDRAVGAYEDRSLPSGELDGACLAVLAAALEAAGCDNADLLNHLRGPGPHVRGCWPVDLILGKE